MIAKEPMDQGDRMRWDVIKKECPKLYQQGMHFECGPGWSHLIHDLSIKIEIILDENALRNKVPEGEEIFYFEMFATQVKEKYGSLRFYMSCMTKEIEELIEEAEALSTQTCENCGKAGKMRGNKWMSVLCDNCFKEPK